VGSRSRYLDVLASIPATLGLGVRESLKEGYHLADLRADAVAGLVVGVVALPLAMALAIASGVAPQHGLYTAIIAGVVAALLGSTRFQVTGPTAAFVLILVPIVEKHGLGGLLMAGLLAGFILVLLGVMRLGSLIAFIPHPVTTGFTAGIAVMIATLQLKDIFGLKFSPPTSFLHRIGAMWHARGGASGWELLIALFTLALLLWLPRAFPKLPAPLFALGLAALLAAGLSHLVPGFHVDTIRSRFTTHFDGEVIAGIPPMPPSLVVPWRMVGADGRVFQIGLESLQLLLPSAFAIAMLGAIESLLSSVIVDGMTGSKHEPNSELVALGIANILCPLFGGVPAVAALARTTTSIRAGARSPLASVVHALFVLLCTVALAPLVGHLPMAALAALLLLVARNMAEARHFMHIVRVAPRSDVFVLLSCFFLTIVTDMVVAISVGVVMAAFLFMRRMAEATETRLDVGTMAKLDLPPGVRLYEVAGPLFFGAAQKAMSVFDDVGKSPGVLILYLGQVPTIDATGLVALETLLAKLRRSGHKVILTGLKRQPAELIERAGIEREPGRLAFAPDVDTAVSIAIVHASRKAEPPPASLPTPA
jgi:sulfate permease, SulP family